MYKSSIAIVAGLFLSVAPSSVQAMDHNNNQDFNALLGNLFRTVNQIGQNYAHQNFVDPVPNQVPVVSGEFVAQHRQNWSGNLIDVLNASGIKFEDDFKVKMPRGGYDIGALKIGMSLCDWSNATINGIVAEFSAFRLTDDVRNANLQQDVCFHVLAAVGLVPHHIVHENGVRPDILLRNLNNSGVTKANFESLGYTPFAKINRIGGGPNNGPMMTLDFQGY